MSGRIIITGANGMVGRALTALLQTQGYTVVPFSSRTNAANGMNATAGWIDKKCLENSLAVIHLAGEPIAQRWTASTKNKIFQSRTNGTRLLARTLAELKTPPQVFISMSGINRYGTHRPNEILTERSLTSNQGFLSEVSAAWEQASQPAAAKIRTVQLRTGVVLAASGGALKSMLPAFKLGLGGPIGGGTQQMSWIRLGDLTALIAWIITHPDCQGPINAVAPETVSQKVFAQSLGYALSRPSFAPMPGWVISVVFGQMGRETILSDLRVYPQVALASGYKFSTPDLASALLIALRE
jgi:uncharacterized protein (TIGR01777 family)